MESTRKCHEAIVRFPLSKPPVTIGPEPTLLHGSDDKKLFAYLVKTESKFTLQNYMKFKACTSSHDCPRKVPEHQPAAVSVRRGI
jgi:hypothetical protein